MTRGPLGAAPRTEPVDRCPVCGGGEAAEAFQAPDRLHGIPGTFRYRRCGGCATVFQSPRVCDDDLPGLYPPDYYTHAPQDGGGDGADTTRSVAGARDGIRDAIRDQVAPGSGGGGRSLVGRLLATSRWLRERAFGDHVMDELLPWRWPAGRALDVGCGSGKLMLQMARVGWEVEGTEWDPEAARRARETTGFPVHAGGATSLPEDLGPFDLVVLSHVIEHLASPVEGLAALRRVMAPRGRLVLVYPNPESLMARRFGGAWYHWDPPRHLVLVPAAALGQVARRAGLRLVGTRTLTRWAVSAASTSRGYRDGMSVGPASRPTPEDRVWGGLERTLGALGAGVGEEIVAVFTARAAPAAREGKVA